MSLRLEMIKAWWDELPSSERYPVVRSADSDDDLPIDVFVRLLSAHLLAVGGSGPAEEDIVRADESGRSGCAMPSDVRAYVLSQAWQRRSA